MSQPSGKLSYRPDVDGLRAVAVLMVFFFHLDFAFIPGGFVGVDVFYVISGYVIFRGILPDFQNNTFSLVDFFDRRLRRIYPALILVVLLSLIAGYFISTPSEFDDQGGAAFASLLSSSNIYFNDRLGYFAAAARTIPLLHTWSLGVEVQFYIFAPLVLLLAFRLFKNPVRVLPVVLVAIVVGSFLYNLVFVYLFYDGKHAFYIPLARFWEIGAGALIALWDERFRPGRILSLILTVVALAGLAFSAVMIDSNVAFPGLIALVPVVSTILLIWMIPRENGLYHRVMTSPPARFFGQISYSLYLFHWPLIVFPMLYLGRDLGFAEKLVVFATATLLSYVSWKFIETPLRRARSGERRRKAIAGIIGSLAALLLVCGVVISTQGLAWRLQPKAKEMVDIVDQLKRSAKECEPVAELSVVSKAHILGCSDNGLSNGIGYVLWGDSHAGMLSYQLDQKLDELGKGGLVATMADCPPLLGVFTSKRKNRAECAQLGEHLRQLVVDRNVPVLVLASRWGNLSSSIRAPGDGGLPKLLFDSENGGQQISFAAALTRTVDYFNKLGVRVVLVGPVPEIDFNVPEMLIRSAHLGNDIPKVSRAHFAVRQEQSLKALAALEGQDGVDVFYPHTLLCDDKECSVTQGKQPLYIDDDHLSEIGVEMMVPHLVKTIDGQK